MNRSILWLPALAALSLLLAGCAPQAINPLVKNEAMAVPGLDTPLHAASANEQNVDTAVVSLYFRYMDEPMLASETRMLSVPRDQSLEFAIVQALVQGPSAGHSELRGLIPAEAKVESVVSRGNILFVTFDEGFLKDSVPDDWANDEDWRREAPTLRRLTVQSLTASLTEQFAYTGVQILVHKPNVVQTNLRLDNAYYLTGASGPSEPVQRDETLLLTPQHTAEIVLTAWQTHDAERLYQYIGEADRPSYATWTETFATAAACSAFSVSGGTVSGDGQNATLCVDLHTLSQGAASETAAYPLILTRESGVWKIGYSKLLALFQR